MARIFAIRGLMCSPQGVAAVCPRCRALQCGQVHGRPDRTFTLKTAFRPLQAGPGGVAMAAGVRCPALAGLVGLLGLLAGLPGRLFRGGAKRFGSFSPRPSGWGD